MLDVLDEVWLVLGYLQVDSGKQGTSGNFLSNLQLFVDLDQNLVDLDQNLMVLPLKSLEELSVYDECLVHFVFGVGNI